ncbi:hypothetical protein B9Z55_011331 [Caenorhabditis nigoni]|nr:hypothetical protein B9Z55_011331 [Caenorhabditis nigoni]
MGKIGRLWVISLSGCHCPKTMGKIDNNYLVWDVCYRTTINTPVNKKLEDMWTNLATEEGNLYVNLAKALTMEYEKALSEVNLHNALAASVPEAPIFMDLSNVQPAGLDHLQMNENWTPAFPFPLNPNGHYWHQDHSLPSSSTTSSGPSSSPEAQQEAFIPGATNGIQNPEASTSATISGVQNPAHPEASTSRIEIPEDSKDPSGEAMRMAAHMKPKATSRSSIIPKSSTWKPWQRPRFKSGCRGMKFLRLENYHSKGFKSTQCFMNTICNMLYSCSEFRELFSEYGDHSSTANKIAEIFKGDRVSAREWRWTLPKKFHVGQHDILTVFDILMENLVLEVPLAGSQLQSVSYIQKACQACQKTSREKETRQFSGYLMIQNGQFQKTLQDTFGTSRKISSPCQSCEAKDVSKMRMLETKSRYLVFGFHATPIKDLDGDSEVQMFGSRWRIRSVAERIEYNATCGHFMAWVRSEEDKWIRVNDDRIEKFEQLDLSRINVKMLVFERI